MESSSSRQAEGGGCEPSLTTGFSIRGDTDLAAILLLLLLPGLSTHHYRRHRTTRSTDPVCPRSALGNRGLAGWPSRSLAAPHDQKRQIVASGANVRKIEHRR